MSHPLPRDRPLWELTLLEGLHGERIALLMKMHHSTIDGVSATAVLGRLFDLEPVHEFTPVDSIKHSPEPPRARILLRDAIDRSREPCELLRLSCRTVMSGARVLERIGIPSRGRADVAKPFRAPRTSFNGTVSARRSLAFSHVSLAEVKEVKTALGVKVNDVLTATVGGALREYLEGRRELPSSTLIAAEPVSIHDEADDRSGNTKLSVMFSNLGTDQDDPIARIRSIAIGNERAKEIQEMMGARTLLSWSDHCSLNTLGVGFHAFSKLRLTERLPVVHNLILSNVAGPPIRLFLAGATVEEIYMFGPIMDGAALNITALSYEDRVGFGVIGCPDLVNDVLEVADRIPGAFLRILRAVERSREKTA